MSATYPQMIQKTVGVCARTHVTWREQDNGMVKMLTLGESG